MSEEEQIERFLSGTSFAVVGASRDRGKYGNRVLRAYLQSGRRAVPVNPNADQVEGLRSHPNLRAVPLELHGVSIITPPEITAGVVDEAIELGITHIWMQPGAENDQAIERARAAGANVISHGPCALVVMGFREDG